jgi:Beta-lactamase enzyme family
MSGRHAGGGAGGGSRGRFPARPVLAAGAIVAVAVIVTVLLVRAGAAPAPAHPAAASGAAAREAAPRTSAPASPASARSTSPPPAADPFGARTAGFLRGRAGTVLAGVYDLRTGQTWTIGSGPPQDEASIVKLDILETLLRQRAGQGTALSAADQSLARQMIEDSDNDAATDLWNEVGGASGISTFNEAAGLARTTPSGCVQCPGFPWPGWGLTTTVPADQLALLREIVEPGPLLPAAARAYALSLMENVTEAQRWGVSGGVPAGVTVALKNGWLPLNPSSTDWQVNSIGWVSGQGRDYLIAVVTTGSPTEQYGIDTIDGLSALIWPQL